MYPPALESPRQFRQIDRTFMAALDLGTNSCPLLIQHSSERQRFPCRRIVLEVPSSGRRLGGKPGDCPRDSMTLTIRGLRILSAKTCAEQGCGRMRLSLEPSVPPCANGGRIHAAYPARDEWFKAYTLSPEEESDSLR